MCCFLIHTVLVSTREGQGLTSLLTSSEDKTAFFNAPTHLILRCQDCLRSNWTSLSTGSWLLWKATKNGDTYCPQLCSGLFIQGGETGQPSYNLCMCDIPNLVTGLELALGREGLVEEDERSDEIRFQLRHQPQPRLLLENRGERVNTGVSHLLAQLMCE